MTVTEIKQSEICSSQSGPKVGVRHIQSLLLLLCGLATYWSRVNVSVAIVAMTNEDNPNFQSFDWNEKEKSYILSSFFWGNILTQIPAGQIGQRYGAKVILLVSVLVPSVLTIITPPCVSVGGWKAFCVLRVVAGFFSGGIFPLFHAHLSKWAPVEERNLLGGFAYSGVQIGVVLAFLSSGLIASTSLGWPGVFYVPGMVGLVWTVIWFLFGANSPKDAKSISDAEKNFIESSILSPENSSKIPTPWKAIFTSLPFMGLIIARISHSWGGSTLLTEMPTYLNSVLKLDIRSNAIYSAIPYCTMIILSYTFLFVADLISRKKWVSLTVVRKTFSTISESGPGLALIGLGFVTADDIPLAIVLLTVAIALSSAAVLGSGLNHIDLAPNHAGILMGIANTIANIISIIAPLVVGVVVSNEKDQSQWRIMFFITAGMYFLGNVMYLIFGRMEKQPWNDPEPDKKDNRRKTSVFIEAAPVVGS